MNTHPGKPSFSTWILILYVFSIKSALFKLKDNTFDLIQKRSSCLKEQLQGFGLEITPTMIPSPLHPTLRMQLKMKANLKQNIKFMPNPDPQALPVHLSLHLFQAPFNNFVLGSCLFWGGVSEEPGHERVQSKFDINAPAVDVLTRDQGSKITSATLVPGRRWSSAFFCCSHNGSWDHIFFTHMKPNVLEKLHIRGLSMSLALPILAAFEERK